MDEVSAHHRDSFSPSAIMEGVNLSANNLTLHIKEQNTKWADTQTWMVLGLCAKPVSQL